MQLIGGEIGYPEQTIELTKPISLNLWKYLGKPTKIGFPEHAQDTRPHTTCTMTLDVQGFAPTTEDTRMKVSVLG